MIPYKQYRMFEESMQWGLQKLWKEDGWCDIIGWWE